MYGFLCRVLFYNYNKLKRRGKKEMTFNKNDLSNSFKEMCYQKAYDIYSEDLPKIVKERLEKELKIIISKGYSGLYIVAQKLIKKSKDDGYTTTTRAAIASSFVANLCDITEVNPLPPHYICTNCKSSEFNVGDKYFVGADLPDKNCIECGAKYKKAGYDIPFEVFSGFDGNKQPDIILNFAEEYLPVIHKYVKEFSEENKLIQDFTQIKYLDSANEGEASNFTVSIKYDFMREDVLKIKILGNPYLSMIKQLEDSTGKKYSDISLDDKKTLKLFNDSGIDILRISELDPSSIKQMLTNTKPETFGELIKIFGFSSGTNVWENNANELIRNNIATLKEVISTRDDIMKYLVSKGTNLEKAYNIMESVRQGKSLTDENVQDMKNLNVPDWYIESCQKIAYLFPKAHCCEYAIMLFRIAYYQTHYPDILEE